jgi:hypothetical protein
VWGRCRLTSDLAAHEELLTKEHFAVDPTVDKHAYWVSDDQITAKEVDVPDPKHKKQTKKQTQHFADSKDLQGYKKSPAKNEKTLAKGTAIVPWLDPWLKAGQFRQETIEGKSWIQVYAPDTNGLYWAEKSTVHFTSDADWPQLHKLEEHGAYRVVGPRGVFA